MHEKAREEHTLVEMKIIPLLSALPKEFINIVFNWTVEDMEEQEDKEAILFLNELKDQNFWPNEEWNVTSIFYMYMCVCVNK